MDWLIDGVLIPLTAGLLMVLYLFHGLTHWWRWTYPIDWLYSFHEMLLCYWWGDTHIAWILCMKLYSFHKLSYLWCCNYCMNLSYWMCCTVRITCTCLIPWACTDSMDCVIDGMVLYSFHGLSYSWTGSILLIQCVVQIAWICLIGDIVLIPQIVL